MDLQQEVEEVKKELVDLIIKHLKENKLDVEKARKLAQDFLAVLPIKDQKDLLVKLKELGEEYPEAKTIYADELSKTEEQLRDEALSKMRAFIKQGEIEEAIQIAKDMEVKEKEVI